MRNLVIEKSITNANNKELFSMYMTDVIKYPVLSPEEEVKLFEAYAQGDALAKEKIILHNLRFVISVANQHKYIINNSLLTLEDLIMEGNIGLSNAIPKYDHTKGFKFISY